MPKYRKRSIQPAPKLFAVKKLQDLQLSPRDCANKNVLIVIEGSQWDALRTLCKNLLAEGQYDTEDDKATAHDFLNSMITRLDNSYVLCQAPEPDEPRIIRPSTFSSNPDPMRLVKPQH